MDCKQYQRNRQRTLEKSQAMMQAKVSKLEFLFSQGHEWSHRELHNLIRAQIYHEETYLLSDHHRRHGH